MPFHWFFIKKKQKRVAKLEIKMYFNRWEEMSWV